MCFLTQLFPSLTRENLSNTQLMERMNGGQEDAIVSS